MTGGYSKKWPPRTKKKLFWCYIVYNSTQYEIFLFIERLRRSRMPYLGQNLDKMGVVRVVPNWNDPPAKKKNDVPQASKSLQKVILGNIFRRRFLSTCFNNEYLYYKSYLIAKNMSDCYSNGAEFYVDCGLRRLVACLVSIMLTRIFALISTPFSFWVTGAIAIRFPVCREIYI